MNKLSLNIFLQLLRKDLLSFRREYFSKLFDTLLFFFSNVLVYSYFMPYQGLSTNYAAFFVVGAIASFGLIEVIGKVSIFIADLEGERAISQIIIMPIRSEMIFAYLAFFWAITSTLLAIFLFPIGKLLLLERFDLGKVSYIKFVLMFFTVNTFFGFFALWLASIIKGLEGINGLWARFISPMWMFGAYFYSWHAAYALNPWIGYLSLINPMVYVMEGMRAAVLGQEGYLPFWISFTVLWAYIIILFTYSINKLKKKLDCI